MTLMALPSAIWLTLAALSTAPAATPQRAQPAVPSMSHLPEGCDELSVRDVVEFNNNSTRIRWRSRGLLESLAGMLSGTDAPVLLLSIEGYQDDSEVDEGLAYERALAVEDALLELGASPARLVPLGHDAPLWPARDLGWSARRVEFDVLLYGACR
ncbi:MAG: outer membrane protein OmpA-like peptidoglycan-associated protein [Myxococcota bacterium]|jgi:outer membrane protein OmpA-like peptidoglycan-associated protein